MVIGIDFDNTIVCYDRAFHRAAVRRRLIPRSVPVVKNAVRDHLRGAGNEDAWTDLQGYVYGAGMADARLFPGVRHFFSECRRRGVPALIISHRTRYPYRGRKYDLHRSARTWLCSSGLLDAVRTGIDRGRVFFEQCKDAKVARILSAGCTHFVDDLPEVFEASGFPAGVRRILFDPHGIHAKYRGAARAGSWREIETLLFG